MPKKLIFPGKARPTRTLPSAFPAVLQMALQIRHNREALLVAPVAGVHLGAVAPLEVVLHADGRLQRPELFVALVPVAAGEGAGEPDPAGGAAGAGLGKSRRGLELLTVGPHVHPEVGVPLEPLPTHLADVHMVGKQLHRVGLDNLAVGHFRFYKVGRFSGPRPGSGGGGGGGRGEGREEVVGGLEEGGSVRDGQAEDGCNLG